MMLSSAGSLLQAFRRPGYLQSAAPLALHDLDTGDLVLFSGRTPAARLVQGVTGSYWSHVGLIVRLPEEDEPLLWECTRASQVADILYGQPLDGVQLVSLSAKVEAYSGEVAIRRLLDAGAGHTRYQRLQPLMRDWHARPYCNFAVKRLRVWGGGKKAAHWRHGGFCSEFVAEVYKRLRLLPRGLRTQDVVPRDFSPDTGLPLLRGQLSPVCLLRL